MAKKEGLVSAVMDHQKQTERYWKEWRRRGGRLDALKKLVCWRAAQTARNAMIAGLPTDGMLGDYAKSLVMTPTPEGGVKLSSRTSVEVRPEASNAATTLVYVFPSGRPDADVRVAQVLGGRSPWTMDTLPWMPTARDARLVYRQVSEGEVLRVRELRQPQVLETRNQLRALGVTGEGRATATLDVGFAAKRAEFGLPGYANTPHMRPAVDAVKRLGGSLRKDKWVLRTLTDEGFRDWKSVPAMVGSRR